LANFWNDTIPVDKNKKPVDVSWKSCVKMMKSPDDFLKRLIEHKANIDANMVPPINMRFIKDNYLN